MNHACFLNNPMVLEYTFERLGEDRRVVRATWSSLGMKFWWVNMSEPSPAATIRKQTFECGSVPIKFPRFQVLQLVMLIDTRGLKVPDVFPTQTADSPWVPHQRQDQPSYPAHRTVKSCTSLSGERWDPAFQAWWQLWMWKIWVRTLPTWNVWKNVPQHYFSLGYCGGKCP